MECHCYPALGSLRPRREFGIVEIGVYADRFYIFGYKEFKGLRVSLTWLHDYLTLWKDNEPKQVIVSSEEPLRKPVVWEQRRKRYAPGHYHLGGFDDWGGLGLIGPGGLFETVFGGLFLGPPPFCPTLSFRTLELAGTETLLKTTAH